MLLAGGLHPGDLDRAGGSEPTTAASAERVSLPAAVRDHLGSQLQAVYRTLATGQLPQRLLDLLQQLECVLAGQDSKSAAAFCRDLTAALPGLRAFALSLVGDITRADDLVQETVLKAWAAQDRFVPGSNFMAWLCTILRNQFYSDCRKRKREVEDADGAMAAQLTTPAAQEHGSDLRVVWAHMAKLPPLQREALLLVGAKGLTYEAAAKVMGCQVGTVKSRVSRARTLLASSLGSEARQPAR